MRVVSFLYLLAAGVQAFAPVTVVRQTITATTSSSSSLNAVDVSRQQFLTSLVTGSAAATAALVGASMPALADDDEVAAVAPAAPSGTEVSLENGVKYVVNKSGDGPKPDIGELAAIRFRAFCGSNKIDDIFDTPEPYYTRIGTGGMLKGVEAVLPLMRSGDRWTLTIPGELAFGAKGRPASAGKPRIPGNAEIVFEVEMVGVPGKEPELIELIGDV
eukprot:CAMPEP_0116550274 /NCGR_PEP_ID=MMETSP0397-20121206/5339_1 /TAXON_ID=216820 /ORGANISM="Cyclophora tenuis, Strain ECT3854" /LENGTH=216 /DNA_ID=CAMNT_0004075093 /DNA_START=9 /DNA_END=659 /DNA_ORIENTATION=+